MSLPWSQTTVTSFLEDGIPKNAKDEISRDIMTNKLNLTKFIEEMGPALTSTTVEMRVKGTKLLSDTVALISADYLDDVQLHFLTTFYIDRLKDHHSVLPAVISGILSMVQMKNFSSNLSSKLLVAMFQHITCQSQVRDDRANVFKIYSVLSENNTSELLAMGSDFVYGVINAIDGERDPRNLLFLFTFMPKFIGKFPLQHLSEEMFEIFSCYFPIDFHPAPNDPAAITRDLLASELSNCLCASESFADECIDLILEKVESQLVIAKLDSLELLTRSTKHFPFEKFESNFEKIWVALKLELLPGGDNSEITAAAYKALGAIVAAASKSDNTRSTNSILDTIFMAILSNLMDVNSHLFVKSMKVCFVCARASTAANLYFVGKLLPIFLQQLQNNDSAGDNELAKKCTIFEMMTELFAISRVNDVLSQIDVQQLSAVQAELVKPLTALIEQKTPNNQPNGLNLLKVSLGCLSKICEILADSNRLLVYETFKLLLVNDTFAVKIDEFLVIFANTTPAEVMEIVVRPLISGNVENNKVFHALAQLLALNTFTDIVVKFLLKHIVPVDEPNDQLQLLALKNLKSALEDNSQTDLISKLHNQFNFIETFVNYVQSQHRVLDEDFLYELSQTMCVIIKKLTVDQQTVVVKTYLPKLNLQVVNDLYLASGILGYLDSSVPMEEHFEDLVTDLTKLSMHTKDESVKQLCNQVICSLFNKMPDNEKNKSILKKILTVFKEEIKQHKHQAVEGLSWIAKALLSQGHTEAAEIVQDLTELLDHPSLKHAAALAFEIISDEYPQLHLPVVKHLFQQKLFVLMLKLMEKKVEALSEHHLTAIAFVLKMTPHVVLKMNISKVGPWLLKCFQLENEKPVLVALHIVNRFLASPPEEYFTNCISDLVKWCLKLATSTLCMKVRIEALVCLKNLTNFTLFMILPYKQEVVLGLTTCLDDKKRLVRNAAVETRMAWYLIGSENTDQ